MSSSCMRPKEPEQIDSPRQYYRTEADFLPPHCYLPIRTPSPPDPVTGKRPDNRAPKKIFIDRDRTPLKFFITRGPRRAEFRELVERHGGEVVDIPQNAWMRLADPSEDVTKSGMYSTEYIRDCVLDSKLINNKDDYAMDTNKGPKGRKLGLRTPYSPADKQIIIECIKEHPEHVNGNSVWKEVGKKYPNHPWQSWRDHALKHIVPLYNLKKLQEQKAERDAVREAEREAASARLAAQFRPGPSNAAPAPATGTADPTEAQPDIASGSRDKGKQPAVVEEVRSEKEDEDAMETDEIEEPKRKAGLSGEASEDPSYLTKLFKSFTKDERMMITKYLQLDEVNPEDDSTYKNFGKLNRGHTWKQWRDFAKAYVLPALSARQRIQSSEPEAATSSSTREVSNLRGPTTRLRPEAPPPPSPGPTPRKRQRASSPEVEVTSSKRIKTAGGGMLLRSPERKVPRLMSGRTSYLEAEDDRELDEKLERLGKASEGAGKVAEASADMEVDEVGEKEDAQVEATNVRIIVEEVEEVEMDDKVGKQARQSPLRSESEEPLVQKTKLDLDKICGVLSAGQKRCDGPLCCKAHTISAKRFALHTQLSGGSSRTANETKNAIKQRKSLGAKPNSPRRSATPPAGTSTQRAASASPALQTTPRRSPRNQKSTTARQQAAQKPKRKQPTAQKQPQTLPDSKGIGKQPEQNPQPQQPQQPEESLPHEYARRISALVDKFTPRYTKPQITEALFMTSGHFGPAEKLLEGGMEASSLGEKGRKRVWMRWEDDILKRWVRDGRMGILDREMGLLREKKGGEEVERREEWLKEMEDLEA
ncbi:hypothetical protein HK097_002228, partial [Rhizophlyctis rosea]